MDTLICLNPDKGAKEGQEVSKRTANMGDGYTQRAFLGCNPQRVIRDLKWSNMYPEDAKALKNFLLARESVTAFLYTYPGDVERAYTVEGVDFTDNSPCPCDVSAKFIENFDVRNV